MVDSQHVTKTVMTRSAHVVGCDDARENCTSNNRQYSVYTSNYSCRLLSLHQAPPCSSLNCLDHHFQLFLHVTHLLLLFTLLMCTAPTCTFLSLLFHICNSHPLNHKLTHEQCHHLFPNLTVCPILPTPLMHLQIILGICVPLCGRDRSTMLTHF